MAMTRFLCLIAFCGALNVTAATANQPSLEDFYHGHQAPSQHKPSVPAADPSEKSQAPASGSYTVTSVSKCFDALGADESAEIKRNSLTPYADCQKRLRERALEKKATHGEPAAETPRNYKRISGDDEDAEVKTKEHASEKNSLSKPVKKK